MKQSRENQEKQPGAEASGVASRLMAFDALEAVLAKGEPLDEAFDRQKAPKSGPMAGRDRAHARLLVLTTLRRLGQIDAVLNRYLTRKPSGKGRAALTLMRLGAAQMMFLETPPHAAVSTLLSVAEKRRLQGFKGLVNAVLRKLAGALPNVLRTQDAARLNCPDWLWTACEKAYGSARARRIAEAHLEEAPLDLTVKETDGAKWAERLKADRLPTGSLRLWNSGAVRELPGFQAGSWWVQDAAAALPARLLLNRLDSEPGARTLADLCAAPGGKTAQLAAAGHGVIAVERSGARLKRLRENLSRLKLEVEAVEADVMDWHPPAPLDGVLLDAPCSATGTIRRHPDLPWRKDGWDREALPALQTGMVRKAAEMLKPGAPLVYATCSLLPEEGEQVVAAALAGGAPLQPDPIEPGEVPGLEDAVTAEGYLRTAPDLWRQRSGPRRGGLDGFFVARLKRL